MLALVYQPYFQPPVVIAAGAALGVLAVVAHVRSFRLQPVGSVALLVMRLALVAALTFLLMGPSAMRQVRHEQVNPKLTLLVDTTASMQTTDMAGEARFAFLQERWFTPDRLAQLQSRYELQLHRFDTAAQRTTGAALRGAPEQVAAGDATHLARSLEQTLGQMSSGDASALLLLTDGRDTEAQSLEPAAQLAGAKGIPVHTVALGGPKLERDLALTAQLKQDYLFAGEPGELSVRLVQSRADGRRAKVTVQTGDEKDRRTVDFEGRAQRTLTLPVEQAEPGVYEYRVSVDPLPGEVATGNNAQSVFVRVTEKRLRVLLLEGQPYWDTKFLAQTLRKDERIELTQISQLSASRRQTVLTRADETRKPMPTTLDELARYDVIVLGRGIEHVLPRETLAHLPAYVGERGGRLVLARGRAYDVSTSAGRGAAAALSELEPVVWGRGVLRNRKLALTSVGKSHPAFNFTARRAPDQWVRALPALATAPEVTRVKAPTRILARTRSSGAAGSTTQGQPVIAAMPYQRGMVFAILGEGLWKWRLMAQDDPQEHGDINRLFGHFWSQTIRWLAMGNSYQPGQPLALRLSDQTLKAGQTLQFDVLSRLTFDQPTLSLTLTDPDGETRELALENIGNTRRRATVTPDTPGVYNVTLRAPGENIDPITRRFTVYKLNMERLSASANPDALRRLAEQTGGAFLDPRDPDQLRDVLETHRAALRQPAKPEFLWDTGWVMVVLLGWAGLEWIGRKKGGLL